MTRTRPSPPATVRSWLGRHLPRALPLAIPLLLAIGMAVVFKHPAMLMFGLMGPLIGLSQMWLRRREQAEKTSQGEQHDSAKRHEHQAHITHLAEKWRRQQEITTPAPLDWLHNPLWRPCPPTADATVRIGVATIDPPPSTGIGQPVAGVPVTIPLHTSLSVVGSSLEAAAVWRAISCQVLATITSGKNDDGHRRSLTLTGVWAHNADLPRTLTIPDQAEKTSHEWSFVDQTTHVPPHAEWVIVVTGPASAQLLHRGAIVHHTLTPDALSFAQSRWVRARLVQDAVDDPGELSPVDAGDRQSLWCDVSAGHPPVNLVAQGPHSLVWGKTGSGKSVLLHQMVTSMCARYSPEMLSIVGIDFKGGATLRPLMAYPHSQGLLTDLTPLATNRVTRSLRAEIRRREHLFADHHVATWHDLPGDVSCPRVVIVVDEAGVVAEEAPELMAVISDIARRGRSLGLHLLISTQQPQQLPRQVIANCALRLCLGITDAGEASQYAPDIPAHLLTTLRHSPPGSIVLPGPDGHYTLTTVHTTGADVSWDTAPHLPLWCEELPETITSDALDQTTRPPGSFLVGLADYPDQQTQQPWWYRPGHHGPLVIVGERGAGHTTCLTQLDNQASQVGSDVWWAGSTPEVMAGQLLHLIHRESVTPIVFLVDRVDRLLDRVTPDGHTWILDTLDSLARRLAERGNGSTVVVTTTPGNSVASAVLRWNATVALLRHRDPTQWALAAGPTPLHDDNAPPGRAVISGVAVHWCVGDNTTRPSTLAPPVARAPEGALVVSSAVIDGANVMAVAEAEREWQQVKSATHTPTGAVFSEVPHQVVRGWLGPGHTTPPVVTAWPYGWHVSTGGVRLVNCEALDD